jgi:hypothetical protein
MRDNILGRKEGSVNMRQARRNEIRMVEACERRILEFPFGHEFSRGRQGTHEGWYDWASDYAKTYPGTAMRSRKTSKRHEVPARNLKSPKKKKLINAKDALKVVFDGKKRATMFKARTHISGHLR